MEQLIGSRTIVSTLVTQLKLGAFNFVAILLILLWALSPIGGQATLRAAGTQLVTQHTAHELSYLEFNSPFSLYASDWASMGRIVDSLFTSSMASSPESKHANVDLWGNVRVPMLEQMRGYSPENESQWLDVTSVDQAVPAFTSLLGLPMTLDLSSPNPTTNFGNVSSTIETAYWTADCDPPQVMSPGSFNFGGQFNLTPQVYNANKYDPLTQPVRITLTARQLDNHGVTTICSLRTSYVQVNVSCINDKCASSSIRRSPSAHPVPEWVVTQDVGGGGMSQVLPRLLATAQTTRPSQATYLEGYLFDPDSPFLAPVQQQVALGQVPQSDLSLRFAQLLNTYWIAMTASTALVNNNVSIFEQYSPNSSIANEMYQVLNATADSTTTFSTYQHHPLWLGMLLLSSIILTACALGALVFGAFRRGPDILESFSSLTRDNPFVDTKLQKGGSHLDGFDRARKLRKVRVKLGDVAPADEAGHIAIATTGTRPVARLRPSRTYD